MNAPTERAVTYPLPLVDDARLPLPRARTRGRWPTQGDIADDHGSLGRINVWPYNLPKSERFACDPACAGCGYRKQAAGEVHYSYWGHTTCGPREVKARIAFHLCYDCVLTAREGGREAELIRERLHAAGRYYVAAALARGETPGVGGPS